MAFRALEGWRGSTIGFYLGPDVTVLDELTRRADTGGITAIAHGCGLISETQPFSTEECNARMITQLPACEETVSGRPARNAVALLREHGVPLASGSRFETDGTEIAEYLRLAVNRVRLAQAKLPLATVADLLAEVGTDEPSLAQASTYLSQETGIYLYDLTREYDAEHGSYVIHGLSNAKVDVQRALVAAKINGSRVGHEDIYPANDEVPIYKNTMDTETSAAFNYYRHAYFKALSFARSMAQHRIDDPWWSGFDQAVVDEPYLELVKLVAGEIGTQEIFYDLVLRSRRVIGAPPILNKTYRTVVRYPREAGTLQVISGKLQRGSEPTEAPRDGLNGLRCLLLGKVAGQNCNLANYTLWLALQMPCPNEEQRCYRFDYTTRQTVTQVSDPYHREPVFVTLDGRLVDAIGFGYGQTWLNWRPQSPDGDEHHLLRTQIDPTVADRVAKVIDRNPEQCSEAKYNTLGLANDLVPPVENELIANSNGYEDSFQYYLQKARDGATFAKQKIDEAMFSEKQDITYSNEIEEVRAKASDQLEQICGAGRQGCYALLQDTPVGNLWAMPTIAFDFPCEGYPNNVNEPNYLDMDEMPEVNETTSFIHLGRWLRCHNQEWFNTFKDRAVIHDLPEIVAADPWGSGGSIYAYDGEYLTALLESSTALIEFLKNVDRLKLIQDTVGLEVEAIANRVNALRARMEAEEIAMTINIIKGVVGFVQDALGKGGVIGAFQGGMSMMSNFSTSRAEQDAKALEMDATIKEGLVRLIGRVSEIRQLYDTMHQNLFQIETASQRLKKLNLQQTQTNDDAARAEEAKLEALVGQRCAFSPGQCLKGYRTLNNIRHQRALEALHRAQKLAFIAKRALEFKLGIDFTQERAPGIIVDAPTLWQDSVFKVFSSELLHSVEASGPELAATYVKRLEDYLFGYPFDHPFADEEDTAILSLRDDLMVTQGQQLCLIPVDATNLVERSEQIEAWLIDTDTDLVDVRVNAELSPLSPPTQTAEIVVPPRPSEAVPMTQWLFNSPEKIYAQFAPNPFTEPLVFNTSLWVKPQSGSDTVVLEAIARYYRRGTMELISTETTNPAASGSSVSAELGWTRIQQQGTVRPPTEDEYVTIHLRARGQQTAAIWGGQITTGDGLMEYRATPQVELAEGCQEYVWVDPYTGETLSEYHPTVQRKSDLMRRRFRVKCAGAADAVLTDDLAICGTSGNLEYFETDFSITLDEILAGQILKQNQLAVGNYNYRTLDVGVNLVGSNVKDCSLDPTAGASCYSNLFIPFDLTHGGRVQVRDYDGKDHPFMMSTAVIHHGKALAAERLLTNPLSSTDAGVLEPYKKAEFKGRPLQGIYTLRIHNVPGLRWVNVEDIQIYLHYRYWSAFSNP
jgi:hypothetical protein